MPLRTSSQASSSANGRATSEEEARQEERVVECLRLGPHTGASKQTKAAQAEMLKTTTVVSSRTPLLDRSQLQTPTDIRLREEVFVHFPPSLTPSRATSSLEAHNHSLTLLQPDATLGEDAPGRSPWSQNVSRQETFLQTPGPSRGTLRTPIQHECDHDCCPFTAVRMWERSLDMINRVRKTSPLEWRNLLSSFSIKNAFMFYPPPPTYGFVRDDRGRIQVRSRTGKHAPRLDHERIEYVRRQRRMSKTVPDDMVAGALHGIASAPPPTRSEGSTEDELEPSFRLIFIPWENEVQSYSIRSGSINFGRRFRMGGPLSRLMRSCAIPCSIIRPHRRMSSHVAIFFHCNGEDIGKPSCLRLLTLANALHMTILVPEYPGYGLFEGTPSEAAIKGAMERVVEFLFVSDPSFTPSRLILIGHSIGTGVAVHIASHIHRAIQSIFRATNVATRLPYACPVAHDRPNRADYVAAVRCPAGTVVPPFSAASPSASISAQPRMVPRGLFKTLATTNAAEADPETPGSNGAASGSRRSTTKEVSPDDGLARHEPYAADTHQCADSCERPILCPHYALGGIILLAPLASLRCVEKAQTLRSYGLDLRELERRRRAVPEDVLVPAPENWGEDAHELLGTGGPEPSVDHLEQSSFLFDVAPYVSFNRFPSIDVMAKLQSDSNFFAHTPLLLLHGSEDLLVPPIHSVAIASKLRQCSRGKQAKVYLGLLHGEGHNNLHCAHLIRRFYKDVILLPHLRQQAALRAELDAALGSGLRFDGSSTASPAAGAAGAAAPRPPPPPPSAAPPVSPHVHKTATREHAADRQAFTADSPVTPLRSPPCVSARMTEPIFDVPVDPDPAAETMVEKPPYHSKSASEGSVGASLVTQTEEPYLFFIEPVYGVSGARWLDNGAFSGPLRIRLLYPPSLSCPTYVSTEPATVPPQGEQPSSSSAIYPVTRPSGLLVSHPPAPGVGSTSSRHGSSHHLHHHLHHYHHSGRGGDRPVESQPVSAAFDEALRETLRRTQPPGICFAPASTVLHIALVHGLDHYDVGSIAVALLMQNSVDATVALEQWLRFRRNGVLLRAMVTSFYLVVGLFYVSLAICHGVLTQPSKLRPYLPEGASTKPYHMDARVVVWGVLDGFAYLLLGIVRFYHHRLGLGNLSRYMTTSKRVLIVYATCRITAYTLCAAVGILMSMVIAFTPPSRGGVDWARWSALPYERRVWIEYLPRWTMVASACVHLFFLVIIFLKNH